MSSWPSRGSPLVHVDAVLVKRGIPGVHLQGGSASQGLQSCEVGGPAPVEAGGLLVRVEK
jgi:hypothetical protein